MKKSIKRNGAVITVLVTGSLLIGFVANMPATAQLGGSLPAFVKLQANSPGTQQSGNTNISGISKASQFIGGGAGLTSLNADLFDGLDSTAFLTSLPNPITLSGTQSVSHIIKGINGASTSDSVGVYGSATAGTGGTIGVRGDNFSTTGLGIYGRALAGTGQNFGVWGQSASTSGTGVFGIVTSTSGANYGVFGKTESGSGFGLYGLNNSVAGIPVAILAESLSGSGIGVRATAGSIGVFATAANNGVRGEASSSGASAILGRSTATNGIGAGVEGSSSSPVGYGVWSSGDVHISGDLVVTGSKSGYVTDVVVNAGSEPLDCGDVVVIVGYDAAVVGDIPVIKVKKSRVESSLAVLGPVDCALQLAPIQASRFDSNLPERLQYGTQQYHIHKSFGAIPPGGYARVVTLGAFKMIKADATLGRIEPGDCLTSSPRPGYAMKSSNPRTGTIIGKALGSLGSGTGTIPVFVQGR